MDIIFIQSGAKLQKKNEMSKEKAKKTQKNFVFYELGRFYCSLEGGEERGEREIGLTGKVPCLAPLSTHSLSLARTLHSLTLL